MVCAEVEGKGIGIGGCDRWMEGRHLGRGRNSDAAEWRIRWGISL